MLSRNLAAGLVVAAMAAWASAAELVVAQVAPLSGIEATQGRAYAAGLALSFAAANRAGLNGHTLTLVNADDQGQPELTRQLTEELLARHKPLLLAGYFGASGIAGLASAGVLERHRIALVGFRQSELPVDMPQLYGTRAGLDDEIRKIVEHLGTIGIRRLGLFYEDGAGAARVLAFTQQAAASAGATLAAQATYLAGSVRIAGAVKSLADAAPQAVIVVASGAACGAFIEQFRAAGGRSQIFATSGADVEQLAKRLGDEQMQGVVIAQVTPNPYKVTHRLVKEFNELVARAGSTGAPVSYAMMEGFITGKLIVELVRRAGSAPRPEDMLKTLDRLESLDLGGYALAYGPQRRQGSRWVELTIVTGAGRIRQ